MARHWYIVHTYSGFEEKVKTTLQERIRIAGQDDLFGEILVPKEQVLEMVKGSKKTSERKFFPGYILVNMELNDDTWHTVRSTPKVTGFVGSGKKPTPLSKDEVNQIVEHMESTSEKPKPKHSFEKGEAVRIIDGPFFNFNGIVEEVNYERDTLKVMVTIFGRSTPVELEFLQVEKI